MASLTAFLFAASAHAGSYAATYSGSGTATQMVNNTPAPTPYGPTASGWGGGSGGVPSASCTGTIAASFKWQPAPGYTMTTDPPPTQVVVTETCTTSTAVAIPYQTGAWNTGLGVPGSTGTVTCIPGGSSNSVSTTSVHHTPATGGPTVSLPKVSPSSTGNGIGSSCTVSYTAAISPVFAIPTGAAKDNSGNYNILIGQHCTASLSGIPSALLNNTASPPTYQWSVSGTTFQTWSADTPSFPIMVGGIQIGIIAANPDATYEVDGPGPLTNPTAGWYWNDIAQGTGNSKLETVSCTATVTPPAGQGAAFSVTATQPVTVWTPVWTATGEGASVVVNNTYQGGPGFWLYAGPGPLDFGAYSGMTWEATLSPPPAPFTYGVGSLALVQVITGIDDGFTIDSTPPISFPGSDNGQTGLDTVWPYPWTKATSNNAGGKSYESGDSPGMEVDGKLSAHDNISFEDYLMYCPPSSLQYVPVAKFIWSASMGASMPATGGWAAFTGTAGTVTDAQKAATFLPNNEFPSWTQIVTSQN